MVSNDVLMTPEEAAQLLRVSKPTIYRWVHIGFIPHHKIGGAVRFSRSSLESWLEERERAGRATLWLDSD
ncbi:MAG: hypothetical protein AMXMBFR84_33540 [Candidatus Hydrogenedentota bacterium]